MQARMERDGDIVIVHLQGRVDMESAAPFRKTCLERLVREKVVFNLGQLSFVGSNGITSFVETITDLTQKSSQGVYFCGVGSEFRRIFEASEIRDLRIFDNPEGAKLAFQTPQLSFVSSLTQPSGEGEVQ